MAAAWLRPLLAVGVGVLTGGFAAWAYYDDVLRPLSHTFGLWTTAVALLSARQTRVRAVVQSGLTLMAAVLASYVGKQVVYGIDHPGMPYALNTDEITQWLVLAVVAGTVLGAVFAGIGTPGRAGPIGTAAAVGLLAADAYRRATSYPGDGPVVVGFAVLAVLAVVAVRLDRAGAGGWVRAGVRAGPPRAAPAHRRPLRWPTPWWPARSRRAGSARRSLCTARGRR